MSNDGRRWFEQRKEFVAHPRGEASDTPDLFTRCPTCGETVYNDTLDENANVCPGCGHHFRIAALRRLEVLCDPGTLAFHDAGVAAVDALGFVDSKPYGARLKDTVRKTGQNDAIHAVSARIRGVDVEIACFDFAFMGGSMGSVVGEVITRTYERAIAARRPALVISASGGARMQEGVLSLMQMAKTCAALARLKDEARMPYVSILTHPTTGGVAASFAMLGDVILAEPEALVGFAGPRVIEQTIGQALPDGFQTSEYLLAHGMVDRIVSRLEMPEVIGRLLRQLLGLPALTEDVEEPAIREERAGAEG